MDKTTKNHGMVWVRMDLKNQLVSIPALKLEHFMVCNMQHHLTLAFSSCAWACRSASLRTASLSSSRDTSESDGRLV